MSGLEDLYREIILDHYRSPRNRGELPTPPAQRTEGFNPLCGDEVVVYIDIDDGRTVEEVRDLTATFKAMMSIHEHEIGGDGSETADGDGPVASDEVDLGDLEALRGVVKFPVRIKCATLGWNTLAQALDERAVAG